MKKVVWLSVVFAVVVPASANALDVRGERTLRVEDASGRSYDLASVSFVALGAKGENCDYLAVLGDTTNLNDAVQCLIHERRTAFAPSCIQNETADIVTVLQAGQDASVCPQSTSSCSSYTLKGETAEHVSLFLSEGPNDIRGIQVIHDTLPVLYPVVID